MLQDEHGGMRREDIGLKRAGDAEERCDVSLIFHTRDVYHRAYLVNPLVTIFLIPSRPAYSTYASQVAKSPGNFVVALLRIYIVLLGIEKSEALGGGGFLSYPTNIRFASHSDDSG